MTNLVADKLSILKGYFDAFNGHDVEEWAGQLSAVASRPVGR